MKSLIVLATLIFPVLLFSQTGNFEGIWYTEGSTIDSDKKSTITLVRDTVGMMINGVCHVELYKFKPDSSYFASSRPGGVPVEIIPVEVEKEVAPVQVASDIEPIGSMAPVPKVGSTHPDGPWTTDSLGGSSSPYLESNYTWVSVSHSPIMASQYPNNISALHKLNYVAHSVRTWYSESEDKLTLVIKVPGKWIKRKFTVEWIDAGRIVLKD